MSTFHMNEHRGQRLRLFSGVTLHRDCYMPRQGSTDLRVQREGCDCTRAGGGIDTRFLRILVDSRVSEG